MDPAELHWSGDDVRQFKRQRALLLYLGSITVGEGVCWMLLEDEALASWHRGWHLFFRSVNSTTVLL